MLSFIYTIFILHIRLIFLLELLDSLTEAELDNFELINGISRERIAKQTSKSVDDVNQLVFFYKQTRILSTWLKLK